MELNIAEILKDKPKGTKLYTPIFGEVKYDSVLLGDIKVLYSCTDRHFYMDGKFCMNGECLLFPSKEMRDWSKFAWKKGDVLISNNGNNNIIFIKFTDDTYTHFKGKHLCENSVLTSAYAESRTMDYCLADYSQYSYINLIEKTLGGKLNPETLEIEKEQIEFKDGDIIVTDAIISLCYAKCIFILKGDLSTNENQANSYVFYNVENNFVDFNILDTRIRDRNIRLATEKEKKELFKALAKKGKTWDAEKKAIVDLKPKCELKPFDRCIWKIRNCEGSIWQASFVSYVDEYGATPMGMSIDEDLVNLIILPYNDQTKLLVGTTDEWEGGEQ